MQNPPVPNSAPSITSVGKSCLFQSLLVILVAGLVATLFTAFSTGEAKQNQLASKAARPGFINTPQATPVGQASPTPTISPSNLIGIVSGHWGNDSGAVCADGLQERDVNLQIASLVQKRLLESGYKVQLLQEFDPGLSRFRAAALVSIHADSCEYVSDEATGFKVASAMSNTNPERTRLTACLRNRYAAITGLPLHSTSVTRDMTDYHAFEEIDQGTPAAIIEVGFLNLDRQFLTENPKTAADGIVNGILCFMNNEEIANGVTSP